MGAYASESLPQSTEVAGLGLLNWGFFFKPLPSEILPPDFLELEMAMSHLGAWL